MRYRITVYDLCNRVSLNNIGHYRLCLRFSLTNSMLQGFSVKVCPDNSLYIPFIVLFCVHFNASMMSRVNAS